MSKRSDSYWLVIPCRLYRSLSGEPREHPRDQSPALPALITSSANRQGVDLGSWNLAAASASACESLTIHDQQSIVGVVDCANRPCPSLKKVVVYQCKQEEALPDGDRATMIIDLDTVYCQSGWSSTIMRPARATASHLRKRHNRSCCFL